MNRFEKRKLAIEKSIREEIDEYKAVYKKADDEDRDPTDEERLDIESHLKAIETLKTEKEEVEANIKTLDHVDDIGRELGPSLGQMSVTSEPEDRLFQRLNASVFPQAQKSIGEQFVNSAQYKAAREAYQSGGGRFPSIPTVALEMKGTLLEGASSPGAGSGGGLLPIPQVVPGVVETLFQRLTIADLLMDGQASGNTVRYIVEGTATSGAAGVAEAGAKPESILGLSTKDEPIKKIATLLPVSDEMLEDAPQIQSYINGRLALFVRIEEERQLFRGASGGNEVQGILTSRGVPVYAGGTAVGNYAVQIFAAMNGMRGSAFVEPDWIVMHPTDYQKLRLLTDTAGQFFGGGPFQGPYGNGQNFPTSQQLLAQNDQVWNKPVIVTAGIGGAGTALIGTYSNAQVWRRGGVSVEATNAHSTYFANNLLAIRAEERLGLAVYRPGAYVETRLS
jgi:HK97 family phage major capsid protein